MKPCSLQSDLRFPSALKSSAYLKLTSLLVWSQKMSSLKISQITTCRAHVQLAPWLLKFRSCPDESDIFETAVQSGLKTPSTRIWEKISGFKNVRIRSARGLHFRKKTYYCTDINNKTYIAPISITNLYCTDINIDISFTTYYSRITTVKFAIYTAIMRKDGKTMFRGEWFLQRSTLRVLRIGLLFTRTTRSRTRSIRRLNREVI